MAKAEAAYEDTTAKLEATVKDLDERLAVGHSENDALKARIAALTEDAAKKKTLLDVAEERGLEFAGERDAGTPKLYLIAKMRHFWHVLKPDTLPWWVNFGVVCRVNFCVAFR